MNLQQVHRLLSFVYYAKETGGCQQKEKACAVGRTPFG